LIQEICNIYFFTAIIKSELQIGLLLSHETLANADPIAKKEAKIFDAAAQKLLELEESPLGSIGPKKETTAIYSKSTACPALITSENVGQDRKPGSNHAFLAGGIDL
jgi:hypothetical protein